MRAHTKTSRHANAHKHTHKSTSRSECIVPSSTGAGKAAVRAPAHTKSRLSTYSLHTTPPCPHAKPHNAHRCFARPTLPATGSRKYSATQFMAKLPPSQLHLPRLVLQHEYSSFGNPLHKRRSPYGAHQLTCLYNV